MTTPPAPVSLGPNQPDRPYRGGEGIAAFRGIPQPTAYSPEDFVGSTTEIFAGGGVGLTRLPSGELLRDAIEADPEGWLGPAHVARFGTSTELLVKLLDTGERLFVHLHPDDAFARENLSLGHGKTEAWIVLEARPNGEGYARLGFTRDVDEEEIASWVADQRADELLAVLHEVPLRAGSTLLVPAGMPHAIGPGITLVELQEPSDLSVLLEYEGYRGLSAADAFLGLDPELALRSLDRRAADPGRIAALGGGRTAVGSEAVTALFPEEADRFFRADRIVPDPRADLEAGFSILVVVEGSGTLAWSHGTIPLSRGQTILLPHGAGPLAVTGAVTALRCRPPAPEGAPNLP